MLASVFLAQCQLRYFFLISLFVIYYLGLRSCKHLLRGNKEFKGSGLWQVLCTKKFLLASSLNKGVSYSKNSLCHRGRIYSKSKNQGNTEMTNALSPVDSDFGITIRNRTLKIYSVILIAFELMMSGLLGYRYLSFRSCDKFRDKFPRVVLQRLFELKGITINK